MRNLHQSLRNLVRDERGNVMMTLGLTSLIAVAAVGGSVDFGRAYNQKSKLQNALDSAVVSAVSKLKDTGDFAKASDHGMAVFKGVFANAMQKTTANPNPVVGLDQPVVQFTQNGSQIIAQATLTASTPFMKMVIGHDLKVGADSSGIPPSGKQLEVALMVDLTGSMGWSAASGAAASACSIVSGTPTSKIDFLRCAGEDLLNILLPTSGANNSSVKIGVAPFGDVVNAGVYAASVVDPVVYPATGGSYTPISNLASTKQGPFSGTYSGASTTGSQFGAMGASATPGATVTTAGATFTNGYCASPGGVAATMHTRDSKTYGVQVSVASGHSYSGAAPAGLAKVPAGGNYARSNRWNMTWGAYYTYDDDDYWYSTTSTGYYVPLISDATGLTQRTHTSSGVTGNIGVSYTYSGGATSPTPPSYVKAAGSGYWRVTGIRSDGTFNVSWSSSGHYVPLYTSFTTAVASGCESTTTTSSSKLITCVTERKNGTDVDYSADAIGTNKYVGPYNHGSSSKSNYSSDGKCWSAGRELPAVIPLTNDRSTISTFLSTATVGGATAGHLGTAWASYLLSPDWSNIWPSSSAPAAYSNTGVKKAAILMTDGQYNIQYSFGSSSSNISAKQALMICKEMRAKGIQVYTVGFGFAASATPPTSNIEAMTDSERTTPLTGSGYTETQKALDTLAKCASTNSSYFFPYDGEALRTAFKNIANSLSADLNGGKARLTN